MNYPKFNGMINMSPTRRRKKMESDTESLQMTYEEESERETMKYGENPFGEAGSYWNNNSAYALTKNFFPDLDDGFYLQHEITFFRRTLRT